MGLLAYLGKAFFTWMTSCMYTVFVSVGGHDLSGNWATLNGKCRCPSKIKMDKSATINDSKAILNFF